MAVLNQTKNRSSPLYFLAIDTLEGILRWLKHLFTQNTFLIASDFNFFFPSSQIRARSGMSVSKVLGG